MIKDTYNELVDTVLSSLRNDDVRAYCSANPLGYIYRVFPWNRSTKFAQKGWWLCDALERKAIEEMAKTDEVGMSKLLTALSKYVLEDELSHPFLRFCEDAVDSFHICLSARRRHNREEYTPQGTADGEAYDKLVRLMLRAIRFEEGESRQFFNEHGYTFQIYPEGDWGFEREEERQSFERRVNSDKEVMSELTRSLAHRAYEKLSEVSLRIRYEEQETRWCIILRGSEIKD